jgi:adhesin/invasin
VTFAVSAGGGSVDPATTTTDDRGEARTRWTLGRTAGQNTLTVTAGGATLQIQATATAGRPASITVSAGDNQSAAAGTAVATAPAVLVRDANNNPVEGAVVVFTPVVGGGQVPDPLRRTNAQGIAAASQWILGTAAGNQRLAAQVSEVGVTGNPVVFNATATAGAAATLVANSPTAQSAPAGGLVANPPSVRVVDTHGNPVANVQVTFSIGSGGGQLTGAAPNTNSNGIATVGSWRLGTASGANTVIASVTGVPSITFVATATAGTPATMIKDAGDNQSTPISRPVPIAPSVIVRDASGNGVQGIPVTFTVATGGGVVIGANQTTDANGRATVGAWFVGPAGGTNELTASAPGVASVTFTATATAGPPVSMTALSLVSQGGIAGSPASSTPSVVVRDALGNAASGIVVTFTVTSGGGSITNPVITTGADGIATSGAWTLGTTPGVNTVVASATGLPSVTFTATSVGAPAQMQAFAGTNQAAVQGTTVPSRPAVRVLDTFGNGVPGVVVTFAVVSGGGSVSGAQPVTDVNGIATVGGWTLGNGASNALNASVAASGVTGNPVTFTALAATQITITSAPTNAASGATFNVVVQLRTAGGTAAPVGGVTLTIAKQSGPGTLGGTSVVNTTAVGDATFPISITGAGAHTLVISGPGVGSVVTATITIS